MSSSVFIESAATAPLRSSQRAADGSEGGIVVSAADSNLVVVYGKKGTNFDQKGLEKIIEEKAISSISVIRITSPTPSMQEEENRAEELDESCSDEELDNHGARGSNSESNVEDDDKSSDVVTDSSGEGNHKRTGKDGSSEDGRGAEAVRGGMKLRKKLRNLNLKNQKPRRRRKRVRPEILGLTVEEFYPEEDANVLIKDVLRKAGLPTLKQSEYDFQLYVIMNDHCYTPFTPADQMDRSHVYVKDKQIVAVRKVQPSQPQIVRRKVRIQQPQKGQIRLGDVVRPMGLARGHCLPKRPLQISKPDRVVDATSDVDNDDEDIDVSYDEDDDDGENSESEVSAETDNDRDSDLDFRVTNRKIGKRKLRKLKKLKRLSVAAKTQHQALIRRRRQTQDDQEAALVVLTPTQRTPKCINLRQGSIDPVRSGGKKISTTPIASAPAVAVVSTPSAVRSIIAKPTLTTAIVAQQPKMLSDAIAALPPIPKKLAQPTPPSAVLSTAPPATGKAMPQKTLPISAGIRRVPIIQVSVATKARVAVQQRQSTPPPSQSVKEIIINKVMASPKGGFTDIGALLQSVQPSPLSGEHRHPEAQDQISTLAPQQATRSIVQAPASASRKGFTPLVIEAAAKNQLPAQISLQTHQSRSELAAEHDKQLDLIDSIVKDELQQTGSRVEQVAASVHSDIPKLVKMLESTEKALEAKVAYMPSIVPTEMVSVDNATEADATTAATSETSDDIDIGSEPLLETADDEIPDDILQHMVKLIEDDQSLREEVEKQVFAANNSEMTSVLSATQPQTHPTPLPPAPPPVTTAAPIFEVPSSQQAATAAAPLIPAVVRAAVTPPKKSIIEMAISNVPEVSTRTTPETMAVRKDPIQILRGNGRVITLPPIEAPTTRAKRRAQAPSSLTNAQSPNADTAPPMNTSLNESALNSSLTSDVSLSVAATNTTETVVATANTFEQTPLSGVASKRRSAKDGIAAARKAPKAKGRRSNASRMANTSGSKAADFTDASESQEDDDDPKRLWCICRQPHNNRFMICCDACADWFHGTCVSITKAMGLVMEQNGVEWTCPMCIKKQEEKKQPKITDMLPTKKTTPPKQQPSVSLPLANATPKDMPPAFAAAVATDSMTATPSTTVEPMPKRPPPPTAVSQQVKKTPTPLVTSAQRKFFASTPIPLRPTTVQQTPSPALLPVKRGSVSQSTPQLKSAAAQARSVASSGEKPTTTRTPNTVAASATTPADPSIECIVCRKAARPASIYCSDECIRRHAQNALNASGDLSTSALGSGNPSPTKSTADDVRKKKAKGLFEDLLAMPDRKLKAERVNVFERRTGRVLTGSSAPTTHNLRKWIQDNPTFEVVQPGSQLALEIENKQKQRAAQSPSAVMSPIAASGGTASAAGNSVTGGLPRPVKLFVDEAGKQPSIHRPGTAQQLAKYPQQLTIRPDRVSKSFEYPAPKDDARERSVREKALKRQSSEGTTVTAAAAAASSKKHSEADTEVSVRLNVRRTLRDLIMQRLEATATEGVPKLTAVDVEAFVRKTEAEMYEVFNRETNAKYKAKYRSLIFNIKDPKNKTLFAKICARTVEPRQLVRMSAEELASQELAQWREKEAKHQLEMIKKSELDLLSCAKNYVLKTHKGEEVIEDKTTDCFSLDMIIPVEDVVSVLNNSGCGAVDHSPRGRETSLHPERDQQQAVQHHHHHHHEKPEKDATKSKSSSKEREKDRDRDRDRGRVKERSHDRDRRHRSRDHHHEKMRHKRSRSHSHSRSRSREKRHKSSHKDERRDKERTRDKDRERERERDRDRHRDHHREESEKKTQERRSLPAAGSVAKLTASSSRERATTSVSKTKPKSVPTFSLVDKILESTKTVEEAANVAVKMQRNEPEKKLTAAALQRPVQSKAQVDDARDEEVMSTPSPTQDAYVRYTLACKKPSPIIWSGTINMIDVASFQIALQPIVGTMHNTGRFLPDELDVVGRIGPETVWDYISKIKKSPNKEIAVVRLGPATESETAAYTILYQYLDKRMRLGVIKTSSPQIKDFYIFPLGAIQEVPAILRTGERVDFYEDTSKPDMLMGILILVTGKRSMTTPPQQQPAVSIAAASAAALKFPRRANEDASSFTPPGSPKRRRRTHATARKNEDIDVDAIIKAPIASKMQKSPAVSMPASAPATAAIDDADEPYSPGGGSSDDDVTSMVASVKSKPASTSVDPQQSEEDNLKRKMAELNRQIAAQEMEIAGLLNADQRYAATSSKTSKVLANISIPKNLSQILASIKAPSPATSAPPPPNIGSRLRKSERSDANADDDEYNPEDAISRMPPPAMPKPYEATVKMPEKSSTSRLARLSEAELLSMVPEELMQQPPQKSMHTTEPPPPGV